MFLLQFDGTGHQLFWLLLSIELKLLMSTCNLLSLLPMGPMGQLVYNVYDYMLDLFLVM